MGQEGGGLPAGGGLAKRGVARVGVVSTRAGWLSRLPPQEGPQWRAPGTPLLAVLISSPTHWLIPVVLGCLQSPYSQAVGVRYVPSLSLSLSILTC